MIQYLSFERCKPDNESRYFKLFHKQGGYYLEIATGYRGMYIMGNCRLYRCGTDSVEVISKLIEPLKIYAWPKAVPSSYIPGDHIMGCDVDSWSLDYKEVNKKTMRHVRGRGEFPDFEPYREFFNRLSKIIPDKQLVEWLVEYKYED